MSRAAISPLKKLAYFIRTEERTRSLHDCREYSRNSVESYPVHNEMHIMTNKRLAAVAYLLLVITVLGVQASSASQKSKTSGNKSNVPVSAPEDPSKALLLVECDIACTWSLDDISKGFLAVGAQGKARVELGWHVVKVATRDSTDHVTKTVNVLDAKNVPLKISLKETSSARIKAESAEKACIAGAVVACTDAGKYYRNGVNEQHDSTRANTLLQKACDGGDALGCLALAGLSIDGDGVPKDIGHAVEIMQRGCNNNFKSFGIACGLVAHAYIDGLWGTQIDVSKGIQLLEQGCGYGDAESCSEAGATYAFNSRVERDMVRAVALAQKACYLGQAYECEWAAIEYSKGDGISQDMALAAELHSKAAQIYSSAKSSTPK